MALVPVNEQGPYTSTTHCRLRAGRRRSITTCSPIRMHDVQQHMDDIESSVDRTEDYENDVGNDRGRMRRASAKAEIREAQVRIPPRQAIHLHFSTCPPAQSSTSAYKGSPLRRTLSTSSPAASITTISLRISTSLNGSPG